MIGIDTNVLLRLLTRDDPEQTGRAERCISERPDPAPVMINAIVLSEFAWTLERRKRLGRGVIAGFIERVLEADDLTVEHAGAAERALAAYRRGKADFPDYLLAAINAEAGCATTYSFDQDAADGEDFTAVP